MQTATQKELEAKAKVKLTSRRGFVRRVFSRRRAAAGGRSRDTERERPSPRRPPGLAATSAAPGAKPAHAARSRAPIPHLCLHTDAPQQCSGVRLFLSPQYSTVHREAEKRNQFSFLALDRNWWIFHIIVITIDILEWPKQWKTIARTTVCSGGGEHHREKKWNSKSNSFVAAAEQVCLQPSHTSRKV